MTDSTTDAADATDLGPTKPVQIADVEAYEALVDEHDLVLLEFVTSGCGICGSMEPVLGTVARAAPGAIGIVTAGLVPELTETFGVRAVPTLVVLRDGAEVARLDDGFQDADTLVALLETHAP